MKTKAKTQAKRRDNHAGRLELRGTKWLAVWMVGGKRRSQSTGCTDRADAEKWLARQLAAVKTADGLAALDKAESTIRDMQSSVLGTALADVQAQRQALEDAAAALRLADAWEAFRASPRRKEVTADTLADTERRMRNFVAWMTEHHPEVVELRQVSTSIAEEYAAEIRGKYTSGAYKNELCALTHIWRILAPQIRGTRNPWAADNLPRPIIEATTRRPFTDSELDVILNKAKATRPPLYKLLCFLLYTGGRLGDCACMDWAAVDLVRGFISFMPKKTRRYGTRVRVPILPPLRAILEATPAEERKGLILPDMAHLYRRNHIIPRIKHLLESCGLQTSTKDEHGRLHPVLTAHSFRHTFISKAANAGVPFAIVQSIVGHTSAEQSRHYFHESDDATLRAFSSFPAGGEAPQIQDAEIIDVEAEIIDDRLAALDAAIEAIRAHGDAAEIAQAIERVKALAR